MLEAFKTTYLIYFRPGLCVIIMEEGSWRFAEIISVSVERSRGIYSPITSTGSIVVDGVYASCFTTFKVGTERKLQRYFYVFKQYQNIPYSMAFYPFQDHFAQYSIHKVSMQVYRIIDSITGKFWIVSYENCKLWYKFFVFLGWFKHESSEVDVPSTMNFMMHLADVIMPDSMY